MPKLLHDIRPRASGWFAPLWRQRSNHYYTLPTDMDFYSGPYRNYYQAPHRNMPILTSACGQNRRTNFIYIAPPNTTHQNCHQCERALQPRTRRRRRAPRTA